MAYDAGKYGVITRKWFGLTTKHGGDAASGHLVANTTDATTINKVARWYPHAPIRMVKAGSRVLATMTNASNDLVPFRIETRNAASLGCQWNAKHTSSALNPYVVNSTTTFTVRQVKAGEYIRIRSATPRTDKGTAANTASTSGTVAVFLDYTPSFDIDVFHTDTNV